MSCFDLLSLKRTRHAADRAATSVYKAAMIPQNKYSQLQTAVSTRAFARTLYFHSIQGVHYGTPRSEDQLF
jgi:hypothetical protein